MGQRVAAARLAAGLTQAEAAGQADIERTALAKIERGQRHVSALELSRLSVALRRPLDWFVRESLPAVVSRRAELEDEASTAALDELVEQLARDVELLVELELLSPPDEPLAFPAPTSVGEAESAARAAREHLNFGDGPVHELSGVVEKFGLLAFALEIDGPQLDGAYVSLDGFGIALVNGQQKTGRRRFTLAHELGHHVFQDAYATDWALTETGGGSEQMINAFAAHFLLPRSAALHRWQELGGSGDVRSAALRLAVEYRMSWSALCAHLRNIGLISVRERTRLVSDQPRKAEFMELGVLPVEELRAPQVPTGYLSAVLRGYRLYRLGVGRAVELLWGTNHEDELPVRQRLPMDALRGELGIPL